MNSDDRQMRHIIAGTNSAAEGIKNMPYWEAKKLAGDLRDYLSGDCPLEDREATLGALVLADKRSAEISGTDGSYDEQDQAHKNREIVEDFLKDGDIKSALKFNKTLEKAGQEVENVSINKGGSKAYYAKINETKAERVPQLMEELNIDEEAAGKWFDDFESMDRWNNRPSVLGTQPEKKPEPEKSALLEDNNLPDGWT